MVLALETRYWQGGGEGQGKCGRERKGAEKERERGPLEAGRG